MSPLSPTPFVPLPGAAPLDAATAQLTQHLDHCAHACGRMHRVRGAVELADAFLASRFVSTLVLLTAMLALLASGLSWLAA